MFTAVFTYPLPGTTTTLHVIFNMSSILNGILLNTSRDLQKLELSRINCYVLYGTYTHLAHFSALALAASSFTMVSYICSFLS